jgi:hypothetical protein
MGRKSKSKSVMSGQKTGVKNAKAAIEVKPEKEKVEKKEKEKICKVKGEN